MRFSLRVNNDLPLAELGALAEAAEEAGFDQLWVSNDLFLRSAVALVGALSQRTSRISLGIAVLNPYSMHVSEIAMAAATLQEVTEGRFLLGVGAGSEEFLGWAGLARPRPLATTAQAVTALRGLLGHDVEGAELPGWYGDEATLRPGVAAAVPVYVGAMGPRMLSMAARVADGALPLLYPPERYAGTREHILASLRDAGRDAAAFDLPACFWVSVSGDREAGRRALAEKLGYYGPSISEVVLADAGLTPGDFAAAAAHARRGEPAAGHITDVMLSLGVAGDADEVIARCRGIIAMGAEHLSFGPPLGPDPVAAVKVLGAEVLPALEAA